MALVISFLKFYWLNDQDFCLDTGYCKEGLKINTERGKITINKENCLKYNWKWDEKNKSCNLRD